MVKSEKNEKNSAAAEMRRILFAGEDIITMYQIFRRDIQWQRITAVQNQITMRILMNRAETQTVWTAHQRTEMYPTHRAEMQLAHRAETHLTHRAETQLTHRTEMHQIRRAKMHQIRRAKMHQMHRAEMHPTYAAEMHSTRQAGINIA